MFDKKIDFGVQLCVVFFLFVSKSSLGKDVFELDTLEVTPGKKRLVVFPINNKGEREFDSILEGVAENCFAAEEDGKSRLMVMRDATSTSQIINFLAARLPENYKNRGPYIVEMQQGYKIKDGKKVKKIYDINAANPKGQILIKFSTEDKNLEPYYFMLEVFNEVTGENRRKYSFTRITGIDSGGPINLVYDGVIDIGKYNTLVTGIEVGKVIIHNLNGWPIDVLAVVGGFFYDESDYQKSFVGAIIGIRFDYKGKFNFRGRKVKWRFSFTEGIGYRDGIPYMEQVNAAGKAKYVDLEYIPETRVSNFLGFRFEVDLFDIFKKPFFRDSYFGIGLHHYSTAGGYIPWASDAPVGKNVDASSNWYYTSFTKDFGKKVVPEDKAECLEAYGKLTGRFKNQRIRKVKMKYIGEDSFLNNLYLNFLPEFSGRKKNKKMKPKLLLQFLKAGGDIQEFYHLSGYMDADIKIQVISNDEETVDIQYIVNEGNRFIVGKIESSDQLSNNSVWKEGEIFDARYSKKLSFERKKEIELYEKYGTASCKKVEVEFKPNYENMTVDLKFSIKDMPYDKVGINLPKDTEYKSDFWWNHINYNLERLKVSDRIGEIGPDSKLCLHRDIPLLEEAINMPDNIGIIRFKNANLVKREKRNLDFTIL